MTILPISKLSKVHNKSAQEVERLWQQAKSIADKRYSVKCCDYYIHANSILVNMLSLSSISESKKQKGKRAKKDSYGNNWWDKKTKDQQRKYLKKHPNSENTSKFKIKVSKRKPVKMKLAGRKPAIKESPDPIIEETDAPKEVIDVRDTTGYLLPEPVEEGTISPVAVHDIIPDNDPIPVTEEIEDTVDHEEEPQDLTELTPRKRGLIHKVVSGGMKRLTHTISDKKITFTHGLKALKKVGSGERLSNEDKGHLSDMANILMGVTLAAAIVFSPVLPYSTILTQLYLEHLSKARKEVKYHQTDPIPLEEIEFDSLTTDESRHLQHLSVDMTDWVMDQDQEELLREAHSRT